MRRSFLQIATALFIFAVGVVAGSLWQSHRISSQKVPSPIQRQDEKEWPLSEEIVSRSLQTHIFRTDKLRINSADEIVWRWLKKSVAEYPQNWVRLDISEKEIYGVVIYPPKILDSTTLAYYNKELNGKGMPSLLKGKYYLPVQLNQGNIICPNWNGLIDPEQAKLVYFYGHSG